MGPLGAVKVHHRAVVEPCQPGFGGFPSLASTLAAKSCCTVLSDKVPSLLLVTDCPSPRLLCYMRSCLRLFHWLFFRVVCHACGPVCVHVLVCVRMRGCVPFRA